MMSKADDEITHLLRRAERPVAVEGLFESAWRSEQRVSPKSATPKERSSQGTRSASQRAWELLLTILRSVKR
jgi:hypothetical protein